MDIFDPLSPGMLDNPYPVYATLRVEEPVHWSSRLDAWVSTRHSDCLRVLQDISSFASDFRLIGEHPPEEVLSIQTLDPPEHRVLRGPILRAMRRIDLRAWMASAAQVAEKLLSEADPAGFDFVTEFAEPFAAATICMLFGVPLDEDPVAFRAAQRDLVLSMDSGLAPERRDAGNRARRYLSQLVDPAAGTHHPADGLLGRLDWRHVGDERPYLINSLRAIFVAAYSSAGSMLVNAVYTLLKSGMLDGTQPPRIDATAFNELVRFEGVVQATSRAVVQDTELGGQKLRRGDIAVTVIGSANRDPEAFEDPETLRLNRATNPHLGFGRGIHSCLGTKLALLLGVEVLGLLFRNYRIKQAGDPVRRPTATIRTLDHLPVGIRTA